MEGNRCRVVVGTLCALDKCGRHYLRGRRAQDLVLLSVFKPPLYGTGRHELSVKKRAA